MTMISDWNLNLKENERIDDLLAGGLKIIQNNKEFCFSIDAVLLAHFVTVRKNAKGLDLGTGTGVIPLLLSNRAMKMDALEINPVTCEIAKRNMVMNKLQDKICVQEGDLCKIKEYYKPQSMEGEGKAISINMQKRTVTVLLDSKKTIVASWEDVVEKDDDDI